MKNQVRAQDGKYDFSNPDLVCECKHKLKIHAAENETGKRPCFNEDSGIDGATGEFCDCPDFKKSKSRKAVK